STHRGESKKARDARSVRPGEGEAPRGIRVVARRNGLPGAQTSAHAGHVSSTHRPRSPEQVGVPCAHGRDPAGHEANPAPGTQGLADLSITPHHMCEEEVGPDSFRDPYSE